jgi:peptidoglycan hydrolase CwlO-like protein
MKTILCAVMAAAVVLMAVCAGNYLSLGRQLRNTERQLTESRSVWEQIAAEKEELQKDLKSRKAELREAKLSLTESTERAEGLKEEIQQLKADIEHLSQSAASVP